MLRTLGLLLGCQLAGEFIARGLGLPIPGPVLGLVILLAALALRPPLASALRPTTQVILAHLALMFVPAGAGFDQDRLRHLFRRRTIYPFSVRARNGRFGPAPLGQPRHDPKIRDSHPMRPGRGLYGGGRISHCIGAVF